jgi:predicted DNA-binding transcriptional regulator AlpA
MHRLLKFRAVSNLVGVPTNQIIAWITVGKFPMPVTLPSGKQRWRYCDIIAWMNGLPLASPADLRLEPPTMNGLSELAYEIVQVLEEAKEQILPSSEIAKRIGGDVDITGGSFRNAIKNLRARGIITSGQKGIWLVKKQQATRPCQDGQSENEQR